MDRLIDVIDSVLAAVPDYQEFLSVDEMHASSHALVQEHPDRVAMIDVAVSRGKEPITALRIGEGSKTALLFGCPHPNEPIGAMMLEYLSRVLVEDERLRDLDVTWYLIKTVDPDGTRLNEGWFKGPFTPEWYARNYYRPPMEEQVEWTFPVEYKRLVFNDPLPETRGLMQLIDQIKPDIVYSLHNAGFGGVYYYLSDEMPELYEVLAELPAKEGLPLALGEPEIPSAKVFAPAVFEMPSVRVMYDFHEQYSSGPPEQQFCGGTSSRDYAKGVNPGCLVVVCEVPYFFEPRIADTTLTTRTRRDMMLEYLDCVRATCAYVKEKFEQVKGELCHGSAQVRAVHRMIEQNDRRLDASTTWAKTAVEMDRPGTVAELVDLELADYSALMMLGPLAKCVEDAIATQSSDSLRRVREEIDEKLVRHSERLDEILEYRAIPIQSLVRIELGVALHAARVLQR